MIALLKRIMGRLHPKQFQPFIKAAKRCLDENRMRHRDRRETRWRLEKGNGCMSFGQPDWYFLLDGQQVLGFCAYSNPIRIVLGSDGRGNYNTETAKHEAGHALRMQVGDFGHNPKLRGPCKACRKACREHCFQGWSDTGRRVLAADGVEVAVDYLDGHSETQVWSLADVDAAFGGEYVA